MGVIRKLASSIGRNDEEPNIDLAREIAAEGDANAVRELVGHLFGSNRAIQSDCIKVLYEIGAIDPALISGELQTFASLLDHKNNRLVWGAINAIEAIALTSPDDVYELLPAILEAAEDSGSVIARDRAFGILVRLSSTHAYAEHAFPLLLDQLKRCPTNQLPMYAENALPLVHAGNKQIYRETLLDRLIGIEQDSKRQRVERAIRKAETR
ncbi:hypothetical protein [Cohnella sp. GCM10027633]|uniref:hypothetical protein n=1 Tax=unclassified Cohnella TaxID=2636738 RepID=UPI00363705E5